jgi:RNA polymerase sigma factor (sigma-70 family)
MSGFDPKDPAKRVEATQGASPSLVTRTGVQVVVRDRPPPERADAEPERRPRVPQAIVMPAHQPAEDRDAFIAWVVKQWGPFIQSLLLHHKGVLPESAKDLCQHVLIVLSDQFDKNGKRRPDDVPAFIEKIVDNAVMNHRNLGRQRLEGGADLDAEPTTAPDPERAAMLFELREKVRRYFDDLPEEEAEVVQRREIDEQSFDAIAEALGRHRSTVIHQYNRGMQRLDELARASERATALGARRR